MNIHYPQVERRFQLSSHLLAAFALCTVLMFLLSLGRHVELHWSVPSTTRQVAQTVDSDLPVPVPAPLPPAEQAIATPGLALETQSILVPQVIPVPQPSVP